MIALKTYPDYGNFSGTVRDNNPVVGIKETTGLKTWKTDIKENREGLFDLMDIFQR